MPETEVEVKRPTRLKKMPAGRAASVDNVMIERKNKQLNQATKKLEEKVKSLQERSKTRSLPRVAKVSKIYKSHIPTWKEMLEMKIFLWSSSLFKLTTVDCKPNFKYLKIPMVDAV